MFACEPFPFPEGVLASAQGTTSYSRIEGSRELALIDIMLICALRMTDNITNVYNRILRFLDEF